MFNFIQKYFRKEPLPIVEDGSSDDTMPTSTTSMPPSSASDVSQQLSVATPISSSFSKFFSENRFDGDERKKVLCVKFSPDGLSLASSFSNGDVMLWSSDLESRTTFSGHSRKVSDIAWSHDSRYICSASHDRTLRIWQANSSFNNGNCINTLYGHCDYVFCVDYNHQSDRIVSGSYDRKIYLWDVDKGTIIKSIGTHDQTVTSVNFSSDGKVVLSGNEDGSCNIWCIETGSSLHEVHGLRNDAISVAMFSPHDDRFILLSGGDSLTLKNCSKDTITTTKRFEGHTNKGYRITSAFAANKKYIVSGSEDGHVCIWDYESKDLVQKWKGHRGIVISVACHPTKNIIASAGFDGSIEILAQGEV